MSMFICILIYVIKSIVWFRYSPPPAMIDLQLPEQEFVAIKVPSIKEKEHTFKEKVVGSVPAITKTESTGTISFKKSKFKKSNCRKRLDDD